MVQGLSRADRVIAFIEHLKVPDGRGAGQPLRLREWQKKKLRKVYTRDADDVRLINLAILTMGRKNGKTALVAALVLVHLVGPEAVAFGQLYSIAFDRSQAAIVFNLARNMVLMDPYLSARIKITESSKKLMDPVSGSLFTALSSEARSHHGKSSSFLVFDELAQFGTDDELYSVMRTSTGAHGAEALTWVISTQAPDDAALLSQLIDVCKLPNPDSNTVLFEYAVPPEADPFDEDLWKLSNPALGDFRSLTEMRDFANKAKKMPALMPRFRNLYLNQRVSAADVYIPADVWRKNNTQPRSLEELRGEPCFGGLDLSASKDLTSLVLLFPDENWEFFDIHCWAWKPKFVLDAHETRDKVPYRQWAEMGYLIAKDGKVIDYRWVAQQIGELVAMFDVQVIGFDRWRIEELRRDLDEADVIVELSPVGQGFRDMDRCVNLLEDLAIDFRLRHGDNPLLTWCASNTVVVEDPAGARKYAKNKSRGRIDPIVAMGMAAKMAFGEDTESVYDAREVIII